MNQKEYEIRVEELIAAIIEAKQRYEISTPSMKHRRFFEWQALRENFSRLVDNFHKVQPMV